MNISTKTDIGLVRTENQDSVWGEMLSPASCAAVLCDGMGGESDGGLASAIAVDVISKRIKESFSEMMNRNSVRNLLITAVVAANSIVYEEAQKRAEHTVMGTTCVAAIVFNGTAYIVNVGDSRAYKVFSTETDDCILQVTKDHSRVQELVDKGQITPEEAKHHPQSNIITRAIGADSIVTPDYFEIELEEGQKLLLCSDGLSSYGDDFDIMDICCYFEGEAACDGLIQYANKNGGNDNTSVALITA
ncbi:MAG: Stp1/IreP family PP2C-type Ser/Thr phosphatase [Oscillospiraceae bacterium]